MTTSLQALSSRVPADPDRHTDHAATRHLCAGVYHDRSFRDLVIRKVHNDSRRRVAPSYGFDLVPVVRHAWYAWFLEMCHHTTFLAAVTVALALHHALAIVVVLCACAIWVLLGHTVRNLAEAVRLRAQREVDRWSDRPSRRLEFSERKELANRTRLIKVMVAGCALLGLTPVGVARLLDTPLRDALPAAGTLAVVLATSGCLAGVAHQLRLNANFRAKTLRPTRQTRREQVIDKQQYHECVIYQRPVHKRSNDPLEEIGAPQPSASPFVGTGELVNRWLPPMTIQLLRPDKFNTMTWAQREHTVPPFRAHELVACLRSALRQLSTDSGNERLPGLEVRDRLYVAEPDVSTDRSLFGSDVAEQLRNIIDDHRTVAHHFLETSVPIAGGELVTTVLIGVSLKGRCLSLDVATCALTRTPHDFQVTDRFAEHGVSAVLRAAVRGIFAAPGAALRAWRVIESPVVLGRAWWATKDRTGRPRRGVQVGAQVAIREAAADDWANAQLDATTIYDHMKIVEQRILKATEDFLRSHDVDTTAFEKQATNIVNSGVLNMGGTQTVSQSAIGAGARLMADAAENIAATAQGLQQEKESA